MKKDSQTLKDAITKVEKFNAAQQLTTTILPSSMVNIMSNEDDQCFQCQELGHITWHCPHIRCHKCKEYGHIVMDCPNKIQPSGTTAQHQKVHRNCHTRSSSRHHWEDQERRNRSRSQPRYSTHCSSSSHDLHRGSSRLQQRDRHSHYRNSSMWSHSAHWGHSYITLHDMPHLSHHRSSTHCSSSGYHSQDCSRSHSCPSYRSLKYNAHHRSSHSSTSYPNQRT